MDTGLSAEEREDPGYPGPSLFHKLDFYHIESWFIDALCIDVCRICPS